MASKLRRSGLLTTIFAVPALALALSACSEEKADGTGAGEPAKTEAAKQEQAKPAAEPAKTEAVAKPAVNVPAPDATVDMAELATEGSLKDMWLGSETAPVTIVEYASMTCGHCGNFAVQTWPKFKKEYVDTGKVRYTFREFPLDPRATAAAMLARCAGDNYYPLLDVLFHQQGVWAVAPQDQAAKVLYDTVKIAGFSQESFDACLKDQDLLNNVNAMRDRAADKYGVNATPTFFINGKKYPGALPFDELAAIVDSME